MSLRKNTRTDLIVHVAAIRESQTTGTVTYAFNIYCPPAGIKMLHQFFVQMRTVELECLTCEVIFPDDMSASFSDETLDNLYAKAVAIICTLEDIKVCEEKGSDEDDDIELEEGIDLNSDDASEPYVKIRSF